MEAEESAATAGKKMKEEIEAEITKAMLSRVDDFKQQADNLTLEGVRRALEKDLEMERLSLDAYKKFIKQCLEKYYYGDDGKNASETERKVAEEPAQPMKKEVLQPEDHLRDNSSDPSKNLEGSPGVGGNHEEADHATEKSHNSSEHGSELNEDTIKNAIRKRAPYFRSNLEITLGKVRRLLEEDLQLEKNSLDTFKKFISNELDAILQFDEVQAINGTKKEPKKTSKIGSKGKTSKVVRKPSKDSDSSDSDDVKSEEEEKEKIRKPKKRPAQKNQADTKCLKRQKASTPKSKASGSGKKKPEESDSGKSDGGKSSEDDHSQSSGEEELKKKNEKPALVYGKQVEHLKSVIKSCGMGIPPSVYKRVKQAPESKREAHLIKELEEILEREGLSTDPSEKEIKAVKKRKERAKELEGIDMSNIVSSSRRRTTYNYIPPPKPKIKAENDEDEGEEAEDDDNEEDSDEGDSDSEDSSGASDGDDAEEESD